MRRCRDRPASSHRKLSPFQSHLPAAHLNARVHPERRDDCQNENGDFHPKRECATLPNDRHDACTRNTSQPDWQAMQERASDIRFDGPFQRSFWVRTCETIAPNVLRTSLVCLTRILRTKTPLLFGRIGYFDTTLSTVATPSRQNAQDMKRCIRLSSSPSCCFWQ